MTKDSTTRFSNRVADYVKYRPGYPAAIVTWLQEHYHLPGGKTIADIGSGTGISSRLFLQAGYKVWGIEPNAAMREMSVQLLSNYPYFRAIDGTAEATGLPDSSVGAIVCGQAFHWFDAVKAKQEFKRILKANGIVILIWNERLTESAFEKAYDQLIIQHSKDYVQVDHRNIKPDKIASFFQPQPCTLKVFDNRQVFDFDGLKGRLLSSSYMPAANEDGYEDMINDLKKLFDQHEQNGKITINYATKVYAS